jgi:hypothetical protein
MEPRTRTRLLRRAGTFAALTALLVPATAGAATAHAAKKKVKAPVVTRVTPRSANVGDTLTIRGHYFRRGKLKNTVVFKRDGGRAVFVKADIGTTKMLKVKLSGKLTTALKVVNGAPAATKFRIRVLTTKLGRRFTSGKLVPTIGPQRPKSSTPAPSPAAADGDCDGDGQRNRVDTDDDNDLLPDTTEAAYKLNSCKADTDGDGVTDGYEVRSAIDLNDDDYQSPNAWLPYPGKRPYPNPLDKSDGNTDFDGDSLTLKEEFSLWQRYGNPAAGLDALNYSDGEKYTMSTRDLTTGRRVPTLAAAGYARQQAFLNWAGSHNFLTVYLKGAPGTGTDAGYFGIRDVDRSGATSAAEVRYYDLDGNGYLSDDERDEDGDGLINYDEAHGHMLPEYWNGCYDEKAFHIAYNCTDLTDPDTDGDGVLDGADDQDHDDIPNLMERSRSTVTHRSDSGLSECAKAEGLTDVPVDGRPWYGRVNPFNPCLPDVKSRTCPVIAGDWAPFDDSDNYWILN